MVTSMGEPQIRRLLRQLATEFDAFDREELKDFLRGLLQRVELEPDRLTCRIHYEIPLQRGDKLASPREAELIPALRIARILSR